MGNPGACTACDSGYFCSGGSSESTCSSLYIGTTSSGGSGASTGAACYCAPGYYGSFNSNCNECTAGNFCLGGSTGTNAVQTSCTANSSYAFTTSNLGAMNETDCFCSAGYWGPPLLHALHVVQMNIVQVDLLRSHVLLALLILEGVGRTM